MKIPTKKLSILMVILFLTQTVSTHCCFFSFLFKKKKPKTMVDYLKGVGFASAGIGAATTSAVSSIFAAKLMKYAANKTELPEDGTPATIPLGIAIVASKGVAGCLGLVFTGVSGISGYASYLLCKDAYKKIKT